MRLTRAFVAILVAAGCGGGNGGTPPPQPVDNVSISGGGNLSVAVGQTRALSATLRDAQNNVLTGRQVTWQVTPTPAGAASVQPTSGTQTTLSATLEGSAVVRATSEGKSAELTFTITAAGPPPTTAQVNMTASTYVPNSVTIAQGGTVTWNNGSIETHNVLFDNDPPAGGNIDQMLPNASGSRTFNVIAAVNYHCSFHPATMQGTVNVVAP